jgi:hypothetical protein
MTAKNIQAQFEIRERLTDAVIAFSPVRGPNTVLHTFGVGIRSGYRHWLRSDNLSRKFGDQISFFEIADMLATGDV